MRRLILILSLLLWVSLPAIAGPDEDPDYILSLSEGSGAPGSEVTITSILDTSDGEELNGFQFGVCHDSDVLEIIEDGLVPVDVLDLDTTFCSRTIQGTDGWNCGYLMNVVSGATLDPDVHNLIDTTYSVNEDAEVDTATSLDFCTLGTPEVPPAVVFDGTSVTPTQESQDISIIALPQFIRGDCNDSGAVTMVDAIFLVAAVFTSGPQGTCFLACDANDDAELSVLDPLLILEWLYTNGPEPAAPFSDGCGTASGQADEDCESQASCE